MPHRLRCFILSGLAFLAPSFALAETPKVNYNCDRGVVVSVTYADATALLDYKGTIVSLTQQPVASGFSYTSDRHAIRGKGDEMIWTDAAGIARTCLDERASMAKPQVTPPMFNLAGTSWRLSHFQSSDDAIGRIVPPRLDRYTLTFGSDGALTMQLDCNRLRANWTAEPADDTGGSLSVAPGAMTRAGCRPGAIDTRIAADLPRLRSYTLADGMLNLALMADGGIYVWRPAAE